MADRVRRDLAPARSLRPRHVGAQARRTQRTRRKAPRAATVASLQHQAPLAAAEPERRVVVVEHRAWMRHRRRITAPAGSVTAPQTKTLSQLATWLTAVPRSWRTASGQWLNPWIDASLVDPPWVLTGSRPCGHAVSPAATNGPPSP